MGLSKKDVRNQIKQQTSVLTSDEKQVLSERTLFLLESDPLFIDAEVVALYWSLKDEVETHDFLEKWYNKKTILLPVMNGETLYFAKYSGVEDLEPDKRFGVYEPKNGYIYNLSAINLVVVPGVAFDWDNNRLGRGKGYYDRILKMCKCPKIGLCFPHQYIEKVPVEKHDVKLDKVLYA